jgi:ribosomal protein S6--L-glutamate ligase
LYLLQEFVPHPGWDVRVLIVGQRVFSMRRRAAPGDWRTNVALGGTPEPFAPPADWVDLAIRAAQCLETEVAGVDLLPTADGRVLVLEVNGVPGWRALEATTGDDVTTAVADYVVERAATRPT